MLSTEIVSIVTSKLIVDPLGGNMRQDEGKGRRVIYIKKAVSKNMTNNIEAGIAR